MTTKVSLICWAIMLAATAIVMFKLAKYNHKLPEMCRTNTEEQHNSGCTGGRGVCRGVLVGLTITFMIYLSSIALIQTQV